VQARNAADHLLTSEQRRELNRMQREEVQKYLADCEEYENVFTLPDNVELSEAEQEKWNALKQRMAPHFANAEKRYQGILAQLDEQKVQEWREELRDELADLDGLSQEELDQTIEEQVQSKLERMKGFARKKLVEQLMGARIATRQMLKDFKRRQDKKEKVAAKPKKQAAEKKESAAKKSEQSEKSEDKPDASDNK